VGILDLIFPKTCLGCGRPVGYICDSCIKKIRIPKPVCPFCLRTSIKGRVHPACSGPLALDGLVCLWDYEGVIRKAILALKYKFAAQIAREISSYASDRLQNSRLLPSKSTVLIPIPLYWYKKNTRGFNQAEEVGKAVAETLGWEFRSRLLIKTVPTISQTELKREERQKNLNGTFVASPDLSGLKDSNVVLFDDVWTTGSTLKEAAKVLKQAGAKKVWGLTLSRG